MVKRLATLLRQALYLSALWSLLTATEISAQANKGTFSNYDCDGAPYDCSPDIKSARNDCLDGWNELDQAILVRGENSGDGKWTYQRHPLLLTPLKEPRSLRSNFSFAANQLSEDNCYKSSLSSPLLWVTSGAWIEDGASLFAVDTLLKSVLKISIDGNVIERLSGNQIAGKVTGFGSASRPSQIRTTSTGYLLEDEESDTIIQYGWDLKERRITSVKDQKNANEGLRAVYDWAPMENGFLAFGDMESATGWRSAFLYFDYSDHDNLHVFQSFTIEHEGRPFYTRNMHYLASLDEVGYTLIFDEEPYLGIVTRGMNEIRRLPSFPADFRTRPKLKGIPDLPPGPRQITKFYEEIESAAMPMGVYTWDHEVFLLGKEPISEEKVTVWWLISVNPRSGEELYRVRLPTEAAHLTVIPGETWGIIEKKHVQGIGKTHGPYMETTSMILLPHSWIARNVYRGQPATDLKECLHLETTASRSRTVASLGLRSIF